MKKRKNLSLIPIMLFCLCSYSPITVNSDVTGGSVKVRKKIGLTIQESGYSTTSVDGEHLADITFTGELFYMEFNSLLFTGETNRYSFVYRIDISLNRAVKYKGGFLWWHTYTGAAKMLELNVSGSIGGLSNCGSLITVTPNPFLYNADNLEKDISYTASLYDNYGKNELEIFNDTREEFRSTSYSSLSDGTGMLDADVLSSGSTTGEKLSFSTNIDYSSAHYDGTEESYYAAGPSMDESSSLYTFSVYGSVSFTSYAAPSNVNLKVKMLNAVCTNNFSDYNSSFRDESLGKTLNITGSF